MRLPLLVGRVVPIVRGHVVPDRPLAVRHAQLVRRLPRAELHLVDPALLLRVVDPVVDLDDQIRVNLLDGRRQQRLDQVAQVAPKPLLLGQRDLLLLARRVQRRARARVRAAPVDRGGVHPVDGAPDRPEHAVPDLELHVPARPAEDVEGLHGVGVLHGQHRGPVGVLDALRRLRQGLNEAAQRLVAERVLDQEHDVVGHARGEEGPVVLEGVDDVEGHLQAVLDVPGRVGAVAVVRPRQRGPDQQVALAQGVEGHAALDVHVAGAHHVHAQVLAGDVELLLGGQAGVAAEQGAGRLAARPAHEPGAGLPDIRRVRDADPADRAVRVAEQLQHGPVQGGEVLPGARQQVADRVDVVARRRSPEEARGALDVGLDAPGDLGARVLEVAVDDPPAHLALVAEALHAEGAELGLAGAVDGLEDRRPLAHRAQRLEGEARGPEAVASRDRPAHAGPGHQDRQARNLAHRALAGGEPLAHGVRELGREPHVRAMLAEPRAQRLMDTRRGGGAAIGLREAAHRWVVLITHRAPQVGQVAACPNSRRPARTSSSRRALSL